MKKVTKQTFRIYFDHVKPYKWLGFVMLLSAGFSATLDIVMPLYYKKFFDIVSTSSAGSEGIVGLLTGVIISILIIHILLWLGWRIASYINNYFQPKVMENLSNTCFQYLHNHSYNFFTNRFVGSLVRRVNRLVYAFEGIADKLIWDLFPLVIRILGILIILLFQAPLLAFILFGWTVVYLIINGYYTVYKLKFDEQLAATDSEVTAQLADTVTNNINIKVFSSLKSERKRFDRYTKKQFKIRKFTWNLGTHIETIQGLLMIILEFVVFFVAIRMWNNGDITIGHLVLLQMYLLVIFIHIWNFGRIIRDIYKNLADAKEMVEIMDLPHEIQDADDAKKLEVSNGLVEYKNVDFAYAKTRAILKKFNLSITPGEKIGLVGPSGGGKTTLIGILLRFFDIQNGDIIIDKQKVSDVTQDSLRENIALVPQDPILFHRSLMENIRYGNLNATDKEVLRAAKLAHCDEFIDNLPQKYKTFVGERGIKLSGGERQRIAIARAILKNAPILVLDEATSSLDSHSELLIQDALDKLMVEKTTIVIAHRLSTIMKMDRIVVIEKGKIVEEGNHTSLVKKRSGLYHKLWKIQAGGFIA